MSKINIAVLVGSLRRDSFNARLAAAVAKLAPAEFTFKTLQICDLPLYNQDDDANQAAPVKRLKSEITASQGIAVRHAGIQPIDPGRFEERDRSRFSPVRPERVRREARRYHRRFGRRHRHRSGTAASSQRPRLSRCADIGTARGVHPGQRRLVRPGWQHRRRKPSIPARLGRPVCGLGEEEYCLAHIGAAQNWRC